MTHAASEALSTFVRERIPSYGGNWQDQVAVEAALAVGIWEDLQVEDRIERLERSKRGLSRDTFKRRRKKVLGWLAQWLMNEDAAPRNAVDPNRRGDRPTPLVAIVATEAERLQAELAELQRRVFSALFATIGGDVLGGRLPGRGASRRPVPASPWDYYFAHEYMRFVSAASVLLLDRLSFDRACTNVERLGELLPTPYVSDLRDVFGQLLVSGPVNEVEAVHFAWAEFASDHLAHSLNRGLVWAEFDYIQRWAAEQVIPTEPALASVGRGLVRIAETLNVASGPAYFVRRAVENSAAHVQGTIACAFSGATFLKSFVVEEEICHVFNRLTAGRLRNALALSELDHSLAFILEAPEQTTGYKLETGFDRELPETEQSESEG